MKKKLLALFLSSLCAVSLLTGCGKNESGDTALSETTPVTLNEVAHSIFYAPMYVAIEEGYFEEEGIDLTLVTGFGADKTMTAMLTDEADIGFMGSESTIYTYSGGSADYAVNFAQLTQRAGNFLVAREPIENFDWNMLIGKEVLGGRAGGMPQMVFEYILKKNDIDPAADLSIDQSIDFGSTAAAFSGGQGDFTVELTCFLHQFLVIIRCKTMINNMFLIHIQAIDKIIRIAIFKGNQIIKFSIFLFLHMHLIRIFIKYCKNFLKGTTMLTNRFDKFHQKFIFTNTFMNVIAAFFRY